MDPIARSFNTEPAQALQRQWLAALLAGLSLWSLGTIGIQAALGPALAARWAVLAGLVMVYLLAFLLRRLDRNHGLQDPTLLPTFGIGTWFSLLRGGLLCLLAGFWVVPRPEAGVAWAPVALYTSAAVIDYFDGYLARRSRHVTHLGGALDIELDALGVLLAASLAVHYGALPWWYVPLGAARYLFLLGMWIRSRQNKTNHPLPPSVFRRAIAGLQMGFLSAMLWPILSPPETLLAGLIFALPYSFSFVRDWLVVSGAVDPESPAYQRLLAGGDWLLRRILPLVLRPLASLGLGWQAWKFIQEPALAAARFADLGWPASDALGPIFALILGFTGLTLLLGILVRLSAFGALFPLGLTIVSAGLDPLRTLALLSVLGLLILGPGDYALWTPDEAFFRQRAAE